MKTKPFTFYFASGSITVCAFDYEEAKILAQAEAIKKGWDYKTLSKEPTRLTDFLLHKTNALELCAITENHWIKAVCYIDHEDLFHIPPDFANRAVKSEEWNYLTIVDKDGNKMQIPCHCIDV